MSTTAIQVRQRIPHTTYSSRIITLHRFSNTSSRTDGSQRKQSAKRAICRWVVKQPDSLHSINEFSAWKEQCQAQLELGITLALFLWPSLSLAVANNWGGPDSSDKREWFAQSTIDLMAENAEADQEWLEAFLLQVMLDEFEVNVEDDSAYEVAGLIIRLQKDCMGGDFGEVRELGERWKRRLGREEDVGELFEKREGDEGEDETDGEEEEDEDERGLGDVEMDEAPPLVKIREHVAPEVDEDGFTKVVKKRR